MSVDQLRPYQERAQRFWNDAPFDYDPARWSTGRATPFGDGAGTLALAVAQHGSREVFSQRYRQDLLATDAVDVRTMTTAVGLAGASDGGVTGVSARTADGQAIDVRARVVVLAAGGVENAQLLLVTFPPDRGHPANRHDVVGRYLSDHPELRVGYLTLDRAVDPASMADFDVRWAGSTMVSTFLTLDEEFKRREGLLNVSAALVAQSPGIGTATHRTIYSMFGSRSAPSFGRLVGGVLGLARHPRELASYTRSRMRDDRFHEFSGGWSAAAPRSRTFEVHLAAEQTPEPENRITLSTQGDAFGRRRPQLRWSWSARDRENVSRSAEIIRQEVDRMGIGRLDLWLSPASDQLTRFTGLHHPMGSTRISPDPTLGVVDENCRVHGTDNVYVAGSSVFPSGHGYANPTLTVLALAIRLADHIRTVLSAA